MPPSGREILKTLIELLEAQEGIKITYEIKDREEHGNELLGNNDGTWEGWNGTPVTT